ncbi:MAG: ATP-dependent DNA helicase [Bacteroidetes bacterium]|nr:MAG: ATP-dependent DNA helicase [Bacteroidota bacterium]TAE69049.1 MAG: ATP-dependent DNA helicase [Bacteroidota bacterium]TAF97397.1 MAG: ATP-dependent DNA helicase [Bacteroidota bacterium]
MQDYLVGLNPSQREAVEHLQGPLMIVAGAGSGKTKVLTTRIAHLMHNGVDAFNILALTFTNKAAAEMKERIAHILGNNEARNLYIGTFHSVFARILRAEAPKLGYPASFTIYDSDDAKSVVKGILTEMGLDDKTYKPSMVTSRISSAKNALITAEQYVADAGLQAEDAQLRRPQLGQIYLRYTQKCYKNGAMDFDDLLLKMYELLANFPEVLHKYQHKFQYLLIDEYQDTNPVQYQIAKVLAAVHENICVVGDDAQSIYSFRGATIENILQFQTDYDDVKVVKLEQNYRSTSSILNVANAIIKINKGQIPKNLWTDKAEGETIKVVRTMTDNDEGKFVADTIKEQKLRNHFANKDFAILYRTNSQSRSFEESLRRMGIAYKIYGGLSFYQRKEIKDFVAYLRLIANTRDEEALKRIINYPIRGIGKTTVEKLGVIANEQNITMFDAMQRAGEFGFKGGTSDLLKDFATMVRYFQSMLGQNNAYDVAVQVGKNTGLIKELFADRTQEGVARYENVQELLNSIKEWVESPSNDDGEVGEKTLGAYLQQITLLTDADKDTDDPDVVKLMTIHASKGLEFPVVFVAGLEETIFPSGMSINTREELEEERRLFYVAITRAKEKLWLSHANARYRYGQLVQNEPSRFIDEMPDTFVDKTYAGGASRSNTGFNNMGSAFERMHRGGFGGANTPPPVKRATEKPSYLAAPPTPKVVQHTPTENFIVAHTSDIVAGVKVEHAKFGFGVVQSIEGSSHNPVATIVFEQNGEKKIMLNYAKLSIVQG